MRYRRSNKKYLIIASLILVISLGVFLFKKVSLKNEIDNILTSESYSYLPSKAKNYVKEVYESTGEVIRTEKNKVENEPYLNPLFVAYLEMSEEERQEEEIVPMATVTDYYSPTNVEEATYPSSYDSRNVNGKNFVSPSKNQANMGICWAFSSAEVVETYLMKQSNTSYYSSSQLISERQIDYATSINGIKDYTSEYVSFIDDRVLGDGANFYISSLAMASGTSIFPYNSFKEFNDADYKQEELSDVLSFSKSQYEINETINMPSMNLRESTSTLSSSDKATRTNFINQVKGYIQEYGSAYVSTYMNSTCYYNDTSLNNTLIDVYNCTVNNGHAMQIIGWNDNISYKYCADNNRHTDYSSSCRNVVSGKGVWILKNSWGSSIPYPYLAYDSLNTQIHFVMNLTPLSSRTWDNSYILGEGNSLSSKSYKMSDTRIKGVEKLKKVKFITSSNTGTYNVKVYDKDGRVHTYSTSSNVPGLITVTIYDDVYINSNSTITVSSASYYYDRVEFFTANDNTTKSIDLSSYDGKSISEAEFRLYAETKNVPSGDSLTYKVFSNNVEVNGAINVTNNVVAENNVNPLISIVNLSNGDYTLKVYDGSTLIGSMNFSYTKMNGSGTSSDPYIIMDAVHLRQIESDLGAYYELGADIDLTDDTREGGRFYYQPSGYALGFGWKPIIGFHGTLDGKGHTIKGLYQTTFAETETTTYKMNDIQGLFANVSGNLTIKNLILEDFDMTCHDYCGVLFNNYSVSFINGNPGPLTINLDNIVLKNGSIVGVYNGKTIGGLAGIINGANETVININNIYNDSYITSNGQAGYLIGFIGGAKQVNISNLMLVGNFVPQKAGNSGGISHTLSAGNINIKNVLSTLDNSNIAGLFAYTSTVYEYDNIDNVFTVDGINAVKITGRNLIYDNRSPNALTTSNVNLYTRGVDSNELANLSNYSTWFNFNTYWEVETIDGINRYPVLKSVPFDYLTVSDIEIDLDSSSVDLFSYITPDRDVVKRMIFSIADENIATISANGYITPKGIGSTTIHVESLYDGYSRDIPINVTGEYYTIKYDKNGGTGSISDSIVKKDEYVELKKSTFTRTGYNFTGWSKNADGSGSHYSDQQTVVNLTTIGNSVTLYAQWEPITFVIRYNANGGSGKMDIQQFTYDERGSLSKNTFTRSNYKFMGWNTKADGSGKTYSDQESVINLTTEDGLVIDLYAQWENTDRFNVSGYSVVGNYIDLIPYNTNKNSYLNHFDTTYNLDINMNGYNYIYTGSELKLYRNGSYYKSYINIVRGDINGDAKISALDYVAVKNHIMGTNPITNDVYSKAADVNNDGKISALDYVSIKNTIMGG